MNVPIKNKYILESYRLVVKRMEKSKIIKIISFGILIVGFFNVNSWCTSTQAQFNVVKQRIDGFGGSSAWQGALFAKLSKAKQSEILDKLFSTTSGCGLTIYRARIDPWIQPTPTTRKYEFLSYDTTIYLEAKKRGCAYFLATPWTPPAWMKTNNNVNKGGNLKTENYNDYAAFLCDYVKQMENRGVKVDILSIQNEPSMSIDYESCVWTGQTMKNFIKNELAEKLKLEKLSVKVMAAENNMWNDDFVRDIIADSAAKSRLDYIGIHHYWYTGQITYLSNIKSTGKPLWMTEESNMHTVDEGMGDGIFIAKNVHNFMVIAEANAYLHWWLFLHKQQAGEYLLRYDTLNNTYTTTKRLFTIGNYARVVRPNWNRINMSNHNPENGVFVSGYKNTNNDSVAFVIINENAQSKNLQIKFTGFRCSSFIAFRTSSSEDLVQLTEGIKADFDTTVNLTLTPSSVLSIVGATKKETTKIKKAVLNTKNKNLEQTRSFISLSGRKVIEKKMHLQIDTKNVYKK